ncbi:MAG: methylated-DNA--[protein]-cysteine S-methyltransferase [Nitrospirota bacterium]
MNQSSISYDIYESPVGKLYLAFSGKTLVGVFFAKPAGVPFKEGTATKSFIKELSLYFKGSKSEFSQKMKFLTGTEFERKVWGALMKIPFGETRSYKWVAEKIGKPAATRAVGRALSKNPVPVVVPCHRVIESDGSIGGFSSGVETKRRLLDLEYYAKVNSGQ